MRSNKRKKTVILILIALLIFMSLTNVLGQHTCEDSITSGINFKKAAFKLWFDKDIKMLKGIIVLMPGSNQDGRYMVHDTTWQNLATRHHFALLGCNYKDKIHDVMAIEEYVDVKRGSGQALIDILKIFSKTSQHPELEFVPMALWGTSAGGEFNYEFACWKPERVITFVVNKGGVYYSALAPEAAWEVPGVFFIGSKDIPHRNDIIRGIFSMNRRFGAKWMFIEEIGLGHECENSERFVQDYFDKIIPLRISDEKLDSSYSLKKMPSNGYVGISSTKQIFSDSTKNFEVTSWFPDKVIAEIWLEYIK